jgi:serine/threonine protein kinase
MNLHASSTSAPLIVEVIQFGRDGEPTTRWTLSWVTTFMSWRQLPSSDVSPTSGRRERPRALHARKLIHRDVTPRNVRYMQRKGGAIDFGLVSTPGIMLDNAGTPIVHGTESVRGTPSQPR